MTKTLAEVRSKHKPNMRIVEIPGDTQIADRLAEAEQKVATAKTTLNLNARDTGARADLDQAETEVRELTDELEQYMWRFKLRNIGRQEYERIRRQDAPTPEQIEDAKKVGNPNLNWNPEKFPPALIAACLVEVTVGGEKVEPFGMKEVTELWNDATSDDGGGDWSHAEVMTLFSHAMDVNETRRIGLGKGSRSTNGSGSNSRSAGRKGSGSRRS